LSYYYYLWDGGEGDGEGEGGSSNMNLDVLNMVGPKAAILIMLLMILSENKLQSTNSNLQALPTAYSFTSTGSQAAIDPDTDPDSAFGTSPNTLLMLSIVVLGLMLGRE
jgi:hypothetical protein